MTKEQYLKEMNRRALTIGPTLAALAKAQQSLAQQTKQRSK